PSRGGQRSLSPGVRLQEARHRDAAARARRDGDRPRGVVHGRRQPQGYRGRPRRRGEDGARADRLRPRGAGAPAAPFPQGARPRRRRPARGGGVDPGDLVVTPTYERFREIVDAFAGRRVVVLGDLVADEFLHGELARVSREAPVLVLDQKRIELVPGGAGNAVANLRSLDASPVPVGVVGRDDSGERLLATFRRLRIDTSGITSPAGYETPAKSRILAGGVHTRRQQVVRIDRGSPRGDLAKATQATLTRKLARAVKGADGLLVADYG